MMIELCPTLYKVYTQFAGEIVFTSVLRAKAFIDSHAHLVAVNDNGGRNAT